MLPLVAGLTGEAYRDPQMLTEAFHTAMLVTAALAAIGGLLALATIRSDVLAPEPAEPTVNCGVGAPPLRPTTSPGAPEPAGARA